MPERRDADLSTFTMSGLLTLRERVEAEIAARRTAQERSVRRRGGLVERDGPRYRNPSNSAETWSGKGARPAWLEQALARGARLADLEVVDDRPVRSDGPD